MQRRRYSDEDRANALAALAANGGNVSKTADEIGIPERTLHNWATGTNHPEAAELGEEKKLPLADKLDAIAHQLADAIPGKIERASLQQIAVSLGITIEKARLLRGQSTGNLILEVVEEIVEAPAHHLTNGHATDRPAVPSAN